MKTSRDLGSLVLSIVLISCGSGSAPDVTAPTVGDAGVISTNLATTSVKLTWTAATDEGSAASDLQYLAYRSTAANLDTIADIETNGTALGSYVSDISTMTDTALTPNTTYHYNVIVKDEAGNKAVYSSTSATTSTVIYLFEEGMARNGDLKTAGGLATARASGDALCESKRAASHPTLNCLTSKVFLSITTDDEIRDLPSNYSLPTTLQLQGPTGTKVADNWADLLDNSIDATLNAAVVTDDLLFWSGSEGGASDGSQSGGSCDAYTNSSGGGPSGGAGQANLTGFPLAIGNSDCDGLLVYLCICW